MNLLTADIDGGPGAGDVLHGDAVVVDAQQAGAFGKDGG